MYHELKKQNINIREIYIMDAAWQAKSSVINGSKLGNDRKLFSSFANRTFININTASWLDQARDLYHVLNTVRPTPPIIGVGHSYGGNVIVNAALMNTRLFHSLILIDPHITSTTSVKTSSSFSPITASLKRRDVWPSRAAATKSFLKSPFYTSWDKRVFDLWVQYGLRDLAPDERPGEGKPKPSDIIEGDNGPRVTLHTQKNQELWTFIRPSFRAYNDDGSELLDKRLVPDLDLSLNLSYPTFPVYRPESAATIKRIPTLRPSVLYVFGGASYLSDKAQRDEKMAATGTGVGGSGGAAQGMVKEDTIEGMGHLIPMDDPRLCVRSMGPWVSDALRLWWEEEKVYEEWARQSSEEKMALDEEFASRLVNMKGSKANPKL